MSKFPILVASVPKSGTYLVGRILENLGIKNTGWHICENYWQDYSGADSESARLHPENYTKEGKAMDIARRIPPGMFAVTHVGPDLLKLDSSVRVIFIHRNIREVLASWANWIKRTNRWSNESGWMETTEPSQLLQNFIEEHRSKIAPEILNVIKWNNVEDVCKLSFNGLVGRFGLEVQKNHATSIAHALNFEVPVNTVMESITDAMESPTLTKSENPSRSTPEPEWSEALNKIFEETGLNEANKNLGYETEELMCLRQRYLAAEKHLITCPICDYAKHDTILKVDRYGLPINTVLCTRCLHGFINPIPSTAWFDNFYRDLYWKIYATEGFAQEQKLSISRCRQMLEKIGGHFENRPTKLLDIGCGTGGMLTNFSEKFPEAEIFATDPSLDAVREAQRSGYKNVLHTAWREPHLDLIGGIEFATCIHVLEHVTEPLNVLRNIRASMTPGSYLYVDVPDMLSSEWKSIWFFHIAHVNYFSEHTLTILLQRSGFTPVHVIKGAAKEWPWAIGILAKAVDSPLEPKYTSPLSVTEVTSLVENKVDCSPAREHGAPTRSNAQEELKSRIVQIFKRALRRIAVLWQ